MARSLFRPSEDALTSGRKAFLRRTIVAIEEKKSPYLDDPQRLGDVIAAIQAMGTYKFYKQTFEGWAARIAADTSKADHWKKVFEEHPEFFRLDTDRKMASLVWRRQYPRRFQVDTQQNLTFAEYEGLSDEDKKRVSRNTLTPQDIKTLVDTAIELHSRAVDLQHEKRWWIPLVSSAIGGSIGAAIGAFLTLLHQS
jgi:hypothetical protein